MSRLQEQLFQEIQHNHVVQWCSLAKTQTLSVPTDTCTCCLPVFEVLVVTVSWFQALTKMRDDWSNMTFTFVSYKDTDVSILASFDDIQVLLEDHIVKTMTMKGSPFIGPFEKEIGEWDQNLVRVFMMTASSIHSSVWWTIYFFLNYLTFSFYVTNKRNRLQ